MSAHATVRVVVLTPECNEAGKRVQRRARATAPALRLHWPIPGRRRSNTNSCSRSALHSRDACVRSVVLTRVHVHHPLRAYESSKRYVTFSGASKQIVARGNENLRCNKVNKL